AHIPAALHVHFPTSRARQSIVDRSQLPCLALQNLPLDALSAAVQSLFGIASGPVRERPARTQPRASQRKKWPGVLITQNRPPQRQRQNRWASKVRRAWSGLR